jgi:hypothetical protein
MSLKPLEIPLEIVYCGQVWKRYSHLLVRSSQAEAQVTLLRAVAGFQVYDAGLVMDILHTTSIISHINKTTFIVFLLGSLLRGK